MIKILTDDIDFLVCVKPSGTLSELVDGSPISLPAILMKETGVPELFCVHRLDKEVSGVMVFAKNAKAASDLTRQINNGTFKKKYIAEVHSRPESDVGLLTDLLYHDRSKNKTYVVKRERCGVKRAELRYTLRSYRESKDVSTLDIELLTGRTHQIRVQFASRGMSVLGDRKYGSSDNVKPIRLHSTELSFISPTTNKVISFSSLPIGFKML